MFVFREGHILAEPAAIQYGVHIVGDCILHFPGLLFQVLVQHCTARFCCCSAKATSAHRMVTEPISRLLYSINECVLRLIAFCLGCILLCKWAIANETEFTILLLLISSRQVDVSIGGPSHFVPQVQRCTSVVWNVSHMCTSSVVYTSSGRSQWTVLSRTSVR